MFGDIVDYDVGESYVEISKKPTELRPIYLYFKYYYIYTQIGHGWIK